jgi:hypothetical protein
MNCDSWIQKKNFDFLSKGPLNGQNRKKFFFPVLTIHTPIESPGCVDKKNVV